MVDMIRYETMIIKKYFRPRLTSQPRSLLWNCHQYILSYLSQYYHKANLTQMSEHIQWRTISNPRALEEI